MATALRCALGLGELRIHVPPADVSHRWCLLLTAFLASVSCATDDCVADADCTGVAAWRQDYCQMLLNGFGTVSNTPVVD